MGLSMPPFQADAQAVDKATDVFMVLVKKGSNPRSANCSGVTCLHLAAWYGLTTIVNVIIAAKCDVDPKADDGYKAHWTTMRESEAKTRFPRDCDLYRHDMFCIGSEITPMYLASRAGHTEVVRILVKAGANVNATKSFGFHQGITPLHAAAAKGNVDTIKVLLESDCDPNAAASDGGTALHCAAEFGHHEAVRTLLDFKRDGKRVVDIMASKTCVEADNITALHLAATAGNGQLVQTLVEAGCDINAQASDGFGPIHLAAQNGLVDVARSLIAAKCDLTKKAFLDGCSDLSALHLAVRVGNMDLINIMVDAGADVHAEALVSDVSGVGLLHLAAVCAHVDVIKRLIELGVGRQRQDVLWQHGSVPGCKRMQR